MVKLILRDKEYDVKSGMNLLSALKKCNIIPESVIATRDGEMILDDEILKEGDVVKLVAVISGGVMSLRPAGSDLLVQLEIASSRQTLLAMTGMKYEM